jgi:hypothetical protein
MENNVIDAACAANAVFNRRRNWQFVILGHKNNI